LWFFVMTNSQGTSHSSSQPSPQTGSSDDASHVFSTEAPASTATEPNQSDVTVISTSPPLAVESPAVKLNPRELGRALEGQQLDHVVLEQFVGGGGMGAVFRAWDTSLHRTVAVKVLSLRQAPDVETQRRFQTEARSAARLDHPNIARAHYVGEDRGLRYIVFEYINGTNVRDMVYANGPLPLAEGLSFAMQIAGALAHAWEREVVHRDIKPSNIIITHEGLAKLVDMGLARIEYLDRKEHEETATGVTLGTFDYISPEQARNPRDADIRSDIYSLGCTLFFMLTGRPPYPEGNVLQKLLAHQSDPVPDVREVRPDVPDLLAGVLGTMLAKRPEDRFQTPGEVSAALAGCLEQLGVEPPVATIPAYWTSWAPRSTWWRGNLTWILPALLLLTAVIALGIKWHSEARTPTFTELQIPPAAVEPAESGRRGKEEKRSVSPQPSSADLIDRP
jgi:serine/threonine-protein kinase